MRSVFFARFAWLIAASSAAILSAELAWAQGGMPGQLGSSSGMRQPGPTYQQFPNRQPGAMNQPGGTVGTAGGQASGQNGPANAGGGQSSASADTQTISPAEQAIKDAYTKSKNASSADDFGQIISLCQEGIQRGASQENANYARKLEAWAYNKQGEKYSDAGDDKKALQDFDAALKIDQTLWKAYSNRAISKAKLGEKQDAMMDFDRAISMNPSYANAWFDRGQLKYDQGDLTGAVQDFSRAIDLQPQDADFYTNRGYALHRLGQFREALMDYDRAVQLNPNDAVTLLNRGDAYREQGIYARAQADYREALRVDPKLGRAYISVAWMMATCPDSRYRDVEKGLAAAQKAIDIDGDKDYRYLDTLAAAEANAGQFDDAKTTLEKALKTAPLKIVPQLKDRLAVYGKSMAYRDGGPAEPVPVKSANRVQ